VAGFVWKSHEEHTVERCASLPAGPPIAIPSASLNPWAGVTDVVAAVDAGAIWLWGPTCDGSGRIAWDLPLPAWWPELRSQLAEVTRPLVLATAHLRSEDRAELAEAAAALPQARCSVTHSLHLERGELRALAQAGCAFELDMYTFAFPVSGRTVGPLREWASAVLDEGALAYATSDGGQAHTGDPFEFTARVLPRLKPALGTTLLEQLCVEAPARLARDVLGLPVEEAP
jgi:hypothetical protein